MTEEGARPATSSDAGILVQLFERARQVISQVRGGLAYLEAAEGTDLGSFASRLPSLLADTSRGIWVGTIDGEVVGFAAAHIEGSDHGPSRGVIDAIYVEPEARGVSVGERLLDSAATWFCQFECQSIDVWALPGDSATKALFESAGYKTRMLIMRRG